MTVSSPETISADEVITHPREPISFEVDTYIVKSQEGKTHEYIYRTYSDGAVRKTVATLKAGYRETLQKKINSIS